MLWKSLDRAQVKVYMKYDTIPAPREMDKTVMAICMEQGADTQTEQMQISTQHNLLVRHDDGGWELH